MTDLDLQRLRDSGDIADWILALMHDPYIGTEARDYTEGKVSCDRVKADIIGMWVRNLKAQIVSYRLAMDATEPRERERRLAQVKEIGYENPFEKRH